MMNPRIRFKRKDGTDFPNWTHRLLKEFTTPIKTGKSKKDQLGEFPLYGATGVIGFCRNCEFDGEYILAARVGSVGTVNIAKGKFAVSDNTLTIHTNELADLKFLYYLLCNFNWSNISSGTSQPVVAISKLSNSLMPYCDLEEQQKISAFFTMLDEKISLNKQKLEASMKLKNGLMRKIFRRELKFTQSSGSSFPDWEFKTIDDFASIYSGGTPSTSVPEYWNGDIQWLTPTEINSKYVHPSQRTITQEGLNNSSAKLLPKGAILLTTRATIGACSINNFDGPVTTNQGFQSLVCKDGIDFNYLYYAVSFSDFQKEMQRHSAGSTFLELSSKNLKKLTIPVPSIEEQQKIADFFSLIDQKIEAIEKKIKLLNLLKKGFMQQMFV